jgi:hypothetical protein
MGFFGRVRDKVEATVDRVRDRVEEKLVREPDSDARAAARKHWGERNIEIDDMERRGEISGRLANKWRDREEERYQNKKRPLRRRVYNYIGSGDTKEPGNWGQNFKERFTGDLSGGYSKKVYDRRTGKTRDVYVPPPVERIRRSMYGDSGRGGASKSFRKTVPREFGIARNQDQFGNVVLYGKPTRSSTKRMGGGWGMLYGAGSGVRSFDQPRESGTKRGKRGRRGGGSVGNTGWLF